MAEGTSRHAAGHPKYEVRESRGDPAVEVGTRFECSNYSAAVEYAFEYLGRHDPRRVGKVECLEVVRVDGTSREAVWTYRHAEDAAAGERPNELVARWGYDVTRGWSAPPPLVVRPTQMRRTLRPLRRT